jgi:large subunit ribosomal protein L29
MKASELRQRSRTELQELLGDKLGEVSNLRIQMITQHLENPLLIRAARREIARIRTILNEHERGVLVLPGESDAGAETPKGT